MGAEAAERQCVTGEVKAFLRRAGLQDAIVFDSRVRGDYPSTSDVDVIVVSPRFEGVQVVDRL